MQKFKINTEVLSPVLDKLSQAVNQKSFMPATLNLYCKVENGELELTATDTELTIIQKLVCETEGEPFVTLIPFALLHKIAALNKKSDLEFTHLKKGIKITGPIDVYDIKISDKIEDFPKVPEIPKQNSLTADQKFISTMTKAIETCGKDDLRQFTKVLVELRKEQVTVASSDGAYCVFSYTFKDLASAVEDDLLLTQKFIQSLKGIEELKLNWNEKVVVVSDDSLTIIMIRPETKYAKWRSIIPEDFTSNVTVNRTELIDALVKCNLSSDEFKTTSVQLKPIKLKAADKTNGINISVDLPGEYKGEVESLTVNSEKLLRLVKQVDYDLIELAIHDPKRAVLLRSAEDESYLGLIMPLYN